jgi:glutaconyl-CoA decarboxylase
MGTKTNVFSLGTAASEYYVMHSETAAAAMYARRLVKEHEAGNDIQPVIDEMNQVIQSYQEKSRPAYCAKQGWADEIVPLREMRSYMCAFAGAAYQNPASVCPFQHMLIPRMIRDWNLLRGI